MNTAPTLYLAVAEPLVENSRQWFASAPEADDTQQLMVALKAFPKDHIGAYQLQFPNAPDDYSQLTFRTGSNVNPERVEIVVQEWSGRRPQLLPIHQPDKLPKLDHAKLRSELKQALSGSTANIVERIGLTLQQLQRDLSTYKPEIVVLICHGTREGCALLEDGTGGADTIAGRRLLEVLRPAPQILFLSACHSEFIFKRAKFDTDSAEQATVYVTGEEALEVTATVRFGAEFIQALLNGETAGVAYKWGKQIVANDPDIGDYSVLPDQTPPSEKLQLGAAGRDRVLKPNDHSGIQIPEPAPYILDALLTRRRAGDFIGRRRERWEVINAVLGKPAGLSTSPDASDKRLITLTKEGGIGKTALAIRTAHWCDERACFPGGIIELACESFHSGSELLAALLERLQVPQEARRGDLLAVLGAYASQYFGERNGLLVLDNLDDLTCKNHQDAPDNRATTIIETLLGACPRLKILATCRWPLGLADEYPLEVTPLDDQDALNLFAAAVESRQHRAEILALREQQDSSAQRIVRFSGRHPQSLRLLARQLSRPGMTLGALCEEAKQDLMQVLADPLADNDEQDRLKKVEVSYELSYRHLSEPAQQLFQRLSFLPSGVCCGEFPEQYLNWAELLGEDWRTLLEKELDYYALVHYQPMAEGIGTFESLPPMREFARKKYRDNSDPEWEQHWLDFWRSHLRNWNTMLSGKLPDDSDLPDEDRAEAGRAMLSTAKTLYDLTYANWREMFNFCEQKRIDLLCEVHLNTVSYTNISGNLLLALELAERAVSCLREQGKGEDLTPSLGTLGNVLGDLGEREPAREAYHEALEIYRRLAKAHPAAFEPNVAMTLSNLGIVLGDLGECKPAREAYHEALEICRRLAKTHPAAFEPAVATTLNNLGTVLRDLGECKPAREAYHEALEICRRLAKTHPAAFEPAVATTLNNLGTVLRDLGERKPAREAFNEALAIQRRLAKAHPAAFEPAVATTLNNLGTVLRDLGERKPAREAFNEALAIRRRLAKAHPATFEPAVATTLNNLGTVLRDLGERKPAREACHEALEIYWRFTRQYPQAFGQNFFVVLQNYFAITEETEDDPWWQLRRQMEKQQEPSDDPATRN